MRVTYDVEAALGKLRRADRRLGRLIDRVAKAGRGIADLTPAEAFCPCASLARSIMYQQLSGKAAATIHGRVLARLPGGVVTAEGLLGLSIDDLRACGVSQNKAVALHDLANKTSAGVVPPFTVLAGLPDDEIITRLTQVRGIGRWTVEMLLMFSLGRPDVLPVDDLGVRKGYQRTFGGEDLPTKAVLSDHGERWRPYRSLASWYLWRATELPE